MAKAKASKTAKAKARDKGKGTGVVEAAAPAAGPTYLTMPVAPIRNVLLVGCGGTGSILAEHLARLIRGFDLTTELVLCDGDTVAEANVARQNFAPHEVGANKAEALAFRLSGQFGLAVEARPRHFDTDSVYNWGLIVTATDTLRSRALVSRAFGVGERAITTLWLDVGNELHHGQATIGNCQSPAALRAVYHQWDRLGVVGALPTAAALNPAIGRAELGRERPAASCADAPFAEQGFGVNAMAALAAATLARQALVDGALSLAGLYFNVAEGRSVGRRIDREWFARWANRRERKSRKRQQPGRCRRFIEARRGRGE